MSLRTSKNKEFFNSRKLSVLRKRTNFQKENSSENKDRNRFSLSAVISNNTTPNCKFTGWNAETTKTQHRSSTKRRFFEPIALAFLSLLMTMSLTGCELKARNDAGGIADPQAITPTNKVNPSQDADSSFLYDTSIAELQDSSANILDGQTVQIVGEVIGDRRTVDFEEGHYWITLQAEEKDKFSTISVYCTENTTNLIDTYGAYGKRGTTLKVRGVFNIACPQHDGLCDVHAESSSIKAAGNEVNPEFDAQGLSFGICMLIFGGIMSGFYLYLAKRKRAELAQAETDEDIEDN